MEITIAVAGGSGGDELSSLRDWLRLEPGLRGLVKAEHGAGQPGTMGPSDLTLVMLATASSVAALARSLAAYFTQRQIQRQPTLNLDVTTPGGRHVSIDSHSVQAQEVAALLRQVLNADEPADRPDRDANS